MLNMAEVWEDCREENWDGYQALPVSWDTYNVATNVLEMLPLGIPAPSIGAEPDGDLTLEWYRSPIHLLSVSVSADGSLHYAAMFGPDRHYGTVAFLNEVPRSILELIHRVCTGRE